MFTMIIFAGGLRGEKVDLSAQLKKQQAHVLFQEKTIENIKKQVSKVYI